MDSASYWDLISGALRLDPAAFQAIQVAAHGLRQALVILLLAGASETLGQSVVLILNRVSRGRFCLALFLGGGELIVEALLWIFSVWILSGLLGLTQPPLVSAVRVIALAYAPLLFGFFVFFPSIGPLIGRLLRLWVLLAAIVGISVVFDIRPYLAAIVAAVGFLGRWAVLWLFGGAASATYRWFWRASTGRTTPIQSSEALLSAGTRERG